MRIARTWLLLLGLAVLLAAQPAVAEGWSLGKIVPFAKKSTNRPGVKKQSDKNQGPGALARFDAGTKKLMRGTADLLTLKPLWKPKPPQKRPAFTSRKRAKKKSIWQSWFGPKNPPPIRSMEDFVGLKRPS